MGMENFSPEFKTPEQYIVDITYKIWEEQGVEKIYDWYAPDCPVRSPHGVTTTADEVVRDTRSSQHIFPGRDLLAEDVIIGDRPVGFLSSHRVRSPGMHLGDGYLGPATGRPMTGLAIADCLCRDNRVVEEWVLGDQSAVLCQLGLDPIAYGLESGRKNPAAYAIGNQAMRQRWVDPQGLTIIGDRQIAGRILDTCEAIWNYQRLSIMEETYHRAVQIEGPGSDVRYGRSRVGQLMLEIMASIPDGRFEPHHLIVRQQAGRPVRVALRWTLCGTHSGSGRFGDPTGVPLALLGISHYELAAGSIAREWLVVDETAVYAQIAAHQSG